VIRLNVASTSLTAMVIANTELAFSWCPRHINTSIWSDSVKIPAVVYQIKERLPLLTGNVIMKRFTRVKTIPDNIRRVLSSLFVQNSMTVLHWKPPELIKISTVKTVHMTEGSSFLVQVSSLIL